MTLKLGILLLLSVLRLPPAAQAACTLESKATIPLHLDHGTIVVPVEVNGFTARFILDTGAQRSLVTESAAQRLGLARDQWIGTTMRGIGGIDRRPNANPRTLSLGGVPLARRTLNHDTSLTVGLLPRAVLDNTVIDGALGRDFLSPFDLDLDLPNGRLTLYQVRDCAGRFLPWGSRYSSIRVSAPAEHAMVLAARLDDRVLRAMLDTGASASLLAAPGIFRLGLQATALAGDPADEVSGIGTRAVTMHRHTFHTLRIGSERIDNPTMWVAPLRLTPIVDMLLGADWLITRRIWISYATQQLFLADK